MLCPRWDTVNNTMRRLAELSNCTRQHPHRCRTTSSARLNKLVETWAEFQQTSRSVARLERSHFRPALPRARLRIDVDRPARLIQRAQLLHAPRYSQAPLWFILRAGYPGESPNCPRGNWSVHGRQNPSLFIAQRLHTAAVPHRAAGRMREPGSARTTIGRAAACRSGRSQRASAYRFGLRGIDRHQRHLALSRRIRCVFDRPCRVQDCGERMQQAHSLDRGLHQKSAVQRVGARRSRAKTSAEVIAPGLPDLHQYRRVVAGTDVGQHHAALRAGGNSIRSQDVVDAPPDIALAHIPPRRPPRE